MSEKTSFEGDLVSTDIWNKLSRGWPSSGFGVFFNMAMNEAHVREILPLEERAIERGVDISCCTHSPLGTKDAGYCLSEGEDLRFLCQPVNGLVALRKRDNHVAKAKATLLNSLEFFEQAYLPDYRPGLRPLVVVPGGSLVPCSTHITKYPAQNKMAKEFS